MQYSPPSLAKDPESVQKADKEAREAVKQRHKQEKEAEKEKHKDEPEFGVPASPADLARAPSPLSPRSKAALDAAQVALRGDALDQSEDESTDSKASGSDVEFVQDHPDDVAALQKLSRKPPPAPEPILGERGFAPAELSLPAHVEPGSQVDEEPEDQGDYGDDEEEGEGDEGPESEFVAAEAREAAEDEVEFEDFDMSRFFWAVPTGSTTGKQKLMVHDDDEESGVRLATQEETEEFAEHAGSGDDDD
jgi:hypothetical protein